MAGNRAPLIGFAGPRVIRETIKQDLPEGFQNSEFLLIMDLWTLSSIGRELKERISDLLLLFWERSRLDLFDLSRVWFSDSPNLLRCESIAYHREVQRCEGFQKIVYPAVSVARHPG